MALICRRLRGISRVLSHINSGNYLLPARHAIQLVASPSSHPPCVWKIIDARTMEQGSSFPRFSTVPEVSDVRAPEINVLSFVESKLRNLEGPEHYWLNREQGKTNYFKEDRPFLILAAEFFGNSISRGSAFFVMLEKVKFLQQRFPWLSVISILCGSSVGSPPSQCQLLQLVMEEYITFPILLSNKNLSEMRNGACYILVKDFKSPVIYHDRDLDLEILVKAIEESYVQPGRTSDLFSNSGSIDVKQMESTKEPNAYSSLRNLFLYYPSCISADESGNRLFISDSNHHRIIIMDSCGKIMDCIGSSPGFDDGEFESAKLFRPAASFYDADDDCLYFVDSENHAIRRADLRRRVLETLHPVSKSNKKSNEFWTWIMDKVGLREDVGTKPEDFDSSSLMFPWHLIKSMDNNLIIISRSFETLWIMDLTSGKIIDVVKGFSKILELYNHLIMEKVSHLKSIPHDWLQQHINSNYCTRDNSFACLLSSFTTFGNDIILCDAVGQEIFKFSKDSGTFSNFQFSNFGILGLPYWLSSPLEKVYAVATGHQEIQIDHVQNFTLFPGRVDMWLHVDIPEDSELVEPLQDGCIWRQARGAAFEVSGAKDVLGSSDKVGMAQQWYDELDNLVMTPETESTEKENGISTDFNSQDDRIHIDYAVNTSPGTSEAIVNAVLYLKLRCATIHENDRAKYAERIAEILKPREGTERAFLIQNLVNSRMDLREVIFMRPLHVRIKFNCHNHPKSENSRDIILTDSSIEVNVSLRT